MYSGAQISACFVTVSLEGIFGQSNQRNYTFSLTSELLLVCGKGGKGSFGKLSYAKCVNCSEKR